MSENFCGQFQQKNSAQLVFNRKNYQLKPIELANEQYYSTTNKTRANSYFSYMRNCSPLKKSTLQNQNQNQKIRSQSHHLSLTKQKFSNDEYTPYKKPVFESNLSKNLSNLNTKSINISPNLGNIKTGNTQQTYKDKYMELVEKYKQEEEEKMFVDSQKKGQKNQKKTLPFLKKNGGENNYRRLYPNREEFLQYQKPRNKVVRNYTWQYEHLDNNLHREVYSQGKMIENLGKLIDKSQKNNGNSFVQERCNKQSSLQISKLHKQVNKLLKADKIFPECDLENFYGVQKEDNGEFEYNYSNIQENDLNEIMANRTKYFRNREL